MSSHQQNIEQLAKVLKFHENFLQGKLAKQRAIIGEMKNRNMPSNANTNTNTNVPQVPIVQDEEPGIRFYGHRIQIWIQYLAYRMEEEISCKE
jgi:hypothetical protein